MRPAGCPFEQTVMATKALPKYEGGRADKVVYPRSVLNRKPCFENRGSIHAQERPVVKVGLRVFSAVASASTEGECRYKPADSQKSLHGLSLCCCAGRFAYRVALRL